MAGDLNQKALAEPTPPVVVAYLAEIESGIPRWRHARRSALAELRDGLEDATAHYRGLGLNHAAAAARAVQDCGPVALVASEYCKVLANRQARRTALSLLFTGPFVGVLWLLTLVPGQPPDALLMRSPLLGLVVLAAASASLVTVLVTGPSFQWLRRLRLAPCHAAATACAATAVCDALVLATAVSFAVDQPSAARSMPGLVAVTASLVRLAATQRVARRDLRAKL